jgi:hypothetical protein
MRMLNGRRFGFGVLGLVLGLAATAVAVAKGVAVEFPPAGSKLVFSRTIGSHTETVRWQMKGQEEYKGRQVYRLEDGKDYALYDVQTKSWVATFQQGRLKVVSPHNGQLSSPLWVGKSWQSRFMYTKADGSPVKEKRKWVVEAHEPVTVPAGTFDAYRVVSPGKVLTIRLWYAPKVKFFVKRTTSGMISIEQDLVDYTLR